MLCQGSSGQAPFGGKQHNTTLNTAPINAELLDLKNAEKWGNKLCSKYNDLFVYLLFKIVHKSEIITVA